MGGMVGLLCFAKCMPSVHLTCAAPWTQNAHHTAAFSEQSGEALPHGGDGWIREEQVDQIDFSLTFHTGFLLLRFL